MKNPNSVITLFKKSDMIIKRCKSSQIIELNFSLDVELEIHINSSQGVLNKASATSRFSGAYTNKIVHHLQL